MTKIHVSLIIVFVILVVYLLVVLVDFGPSEPATLNETYSVITYTLSNDRGYLEVIYFGRKLGSEGNYDLRDTSSSYKVEAVADAKDGKCILEVFSDSVSVLHIPPNQGVCVS